MTGASRQRVVVSLAARWVILIAATILAFHHSIASVVTDILSGSGMAYIVAVPGYALLTAWAILRRDRPAVPIHDRETDIIVGSVAILIAVATTALLGPKLSGVAYLWRIDLLMLTLFAFGAAIWLFGLRRALSYRVAWLVLALGWPLPLRILTVTIGRGSAVAPAIAQLALIAAIAIAGRRGRGLISWLPVILGTGVGGVLLALLGIDEHPWRQWLPAVAAGSVAAGFWFTDRTRRPSWPQPVVTLPLVAATILLASGVIGALVVPPLPPPLVPSTPTGALASGPPGPLTTPGWTLTSVVDYSDGPGRYFGPDAAWERYRIGANSSAAGPDAVDEQGRRRDVVIDVLTTQLPRSLVLYPVVTTYPIGSLERSPDAEVDLGRGITGRVYAAVDRQRQLTWTLLSFTWRIPAERAVEQPRAGDPSELVQRITVITVDDHRPGAPFPEPSRAVVDSIKAALIAIARASSTTESTAEPKDVDLLRHLGEAIVTNRLGPPA